MDIKIRQVEPGDIDEVSRVESVCFPEAEAAGWESFEKRINSFPESFFVAELGGSIIGFINGCVINETVICDELFEDSSLHVLDGDYQTIFGLDVLPNWRKRGIAAQLMDHMIDVSRKRGKKGVILTCKESLIPYYEKFGYISKGVSESVHGGAKWYDMILDL